MKEVNLWKKEGSSLPLLRYSIPRMTPRVSPWIRLSWGRFTVLTIVHVRNVCHSEKAVISLALQRARKQDFVVYLAVFVVYGQKFICQHVLFCSYISVAKDKVTKSSQDIYSCTWV